MVDFYFDGRIEYFENFNKPETYTIYLKAGGIDPEHYRSLDGKWLDENGKPVGILKDERPGERLGSFWLVVNSTIFDLDSMEVLDVGAE